MDDVKRWDVIVLRRYALRRPSAPVVKRVVGLPGEIISIAGTNVYIDGDMLVVPGNLVMNLSDFTGPGFTFLEIGAGSTFFERGRWSHTIPQDCLFVVGDNLRHSRDSRTDGPVSFADVIGKVIQILPAR